MKTKLTLALITLALPSCSMIDIREGAESLHVSPRAGRAWSVGVTAQIGNWRVGPAVTIERLTPDGDEGEPPYTGGEK